MPRSFALITGSGMADFAAGGAPCEVLTRFGPPSAPLRYRTFGARNVLVLPRHGERHAIPPHRINYRANLQALALQGIDALISLNTVGVIPARPGPGELAVPNQLIDYTSGREQTLFEGGDTGVQHVDVSEPFCADLRTGLLDAARSLNLPCQDGGVYGTTNGPRLETAAEIDRYERDGVDFMGMTAMPEIALARELGMQTACLCMIVNPAAGRGSGSIHADIDASIATARERASALLEAFFAA